VAEIQAGGEIDARWWPESVRIVENTDQDNITSTTFIAGSPECSGTFVAPLSGRVAVALAGTLRQQEVSLRVFLSFEIRLGTSAGAVHTAAVVHRGISTTGDATLSNYLSHANTSMVDGLTPKATYFIRTMHSTAGGTGNDISYRRVCVIPVP
jgi:hypothetical protein